MTLEERVTQLESTVRRILEAKVHIDEAVAIGEEQKVTLDRMMVLIQEVRMDLAKWMGEHKT